MSIYIGNKQIAGIGNSGGDSSIVLKSNNPFSKGFIPIASSISDPSSLMVGRMFESKKLKYSDDGNQWGAGNIYDEFGIINDTAPNANFVSGISVSNRWPDNNSQKYSDYYCVGLQTTGNITSDEAPTANILLYGNGDNNNIAETGTSLWLGLRSRAFRIPVALYEVTSDSTINVIGNVTYYDDSSALTVSIHCYSSIYELGEYGNDTDLRTNYMLPGEVATIVSPLDWTGGPAAGNTIEFTAYNYNGEVPVLYQNGMKNPGESNSMYVYSILYDGLNIYINKGSYKSL